MSTTVSTSIRLPRSVCCDEPVLASLVLEDGVAEGSLLLVEGERLDGVSSLSLSKRSSEEDKRLTVLTIFHLVLFIVYEVDSVHAPEGAARVSDLDGHRFTAASLRRGFRLWLWRRWIGDWEDVDGEG
jgi:hypothetical protein